MPLDAIPIATEQFATQVVDAAVKVHKAPGPGLLESVYEACLAHELGLRGVFYATQVSVPISYEGLQVDGGLRLDLLVGDAVIVELRVVEHLLPVHEAQLFTYLKLSNKRLGLLLNFNVAVMKQGIRRLAR